MTQEIIRATVPANNKWHTEDIEKKAAALGMDKGEFMLKAVDMLFNFDETFYNRIKKLSEGLHIPEYIVIQNIVIKQMAKDQAKKEVYGSSTKVLNEFISVSDAKGERVLTGDELLKVLKDSYKLHLK